MCFGVLYLEMEDLRSRVEQQATLIAMLKKRADNTYKEVSEWKSKYERAVSQVEVLQGSLNEEMKQRTLVEQRFRHLADNHEEMIRIMEDYKRKLSMEKVTQEEHAELVEELNKCRVGRKMAEEKCAEVSSELDKCYKDKIAEEEKCSALENEIRKCREEKLVVEERNSELSRTLSQLQLHRVTQLQEHEQIVETLQKEFEEKMCLQQEEMKRSFKEQVKKELMIKLREKEEELSRDSCVRKLRQDLGCCQDRILSLEQEYAAYKLHTAKLLNHERELNTQLRHLLG